MDVSVCGGVQPTHSDDASWRRSEARRSVDYRCRSHWRAPCRTRRMTTHGSRGPGGCRRRESSPPSAPRSPAPARAGRAWGLLKPVEHSLRALHPPCGRGAIVLGGVLLDVGQVAPGCRGQLNPLLAVDGERSSQIQCERLVAPWGGERVTAVDFLARYSRKRSPDVARGRWNTRAAIAGALCGS
jgi:hypothetical protein